MITARTIAKAQPVIDEITAAGGKAIPWALELSDLESVAKSAQELLKTDYKLDCVILNAGLAGQPGLTKQGFEITFGVNHLAHFLLGELLIPRMREYKGSRIVVVASGNHYKVKTLDLTHVHERTRTVTGLEEYGLSKLGNVMTAFDWAKLHSDAGLTAVSLNPGRIATDIWRRIPNPFRWLFMQTMRTSEQGAFTTVHCAALKESELETGAYYNDCAVRAPNPLVLDATARQTMRDRSLEWVAKYR